MITKSHIEDLIEGLLNSAVERKTEQGQSVCKSVLEQLSSAKTDNDLLSSLKNLNRAFIGIEAHGHLTSHEFVLVKELRNIEASELYKDISP